MYVISGALVLGCFFARLALHPWLQQRSPLLPFTAAVVIAAGLYGVGPGLLAVILSVVLAIWFFVSRQGVAGLGPDELTSVLVFIVTSAAMLIFANHLRAARRKAEHLESELQHAQSNAAMGTMAATLAHELNQPLTAAANYIAGCQELASQTRSQKKPSLLKGLEKAEEQIQRAGSIIRHARTIVRSLPVERTTTSLRRMIDRALDMIAVTDLANDVDVVLKINRDADAVSVNPVQIEQVLVNLCRNACEAMGNATLKPRLQFNATSTDRGTLLEIQDNGSGIDPERLSTLFSVARMRGEDRLGIGLSICRTIVEAHGGAIWAQNNPEGGASFFVLLPPSVATDHRNERQKLAGG